jgi:hypothetical protein
MLVGTEVMTAELEVVTGPTMRFGAIVMPRSCHGRAGAANLPLAHQRAKHRAALTIVGIE